MAFSWIYSSIIALLEQIIPQGLFVLYVFDQASDLDTCCEKMLKGKECQRAIRVCRQPLTRI